MLQRLQDVFLHAGHGNLHGIGDFPVGESVAPVQQKGLPHIDRQFLYGRHDQAEFFPRAEDVLGGRRAAIDVRCLAVLGLLPFAVHELQMQLAPPQLVDGEVGRHLEQEGAGVVQGFRRLQPVQAQKGLLGDFGGVLRAVQFAGEIAFQGAAMVIDQAREERILAVCYDSDGESLVVARYASGRGLE